MVGGNRPNVTWRLAAKYADEINLDGMTPDEVRAALPIVRSRCEEIDRDPDTLSVSVHVWWHDLAAPGTERAELIARYGEQGVSRVIGLSRTAVDRAESLARLADD